VTPATWQLCSDDPLNWHKHSTRDMQNNPPSLRHYSLGEMWRTPQAKWVGIQYALYVGCSLFGVPSLSRSPRPTASDT